MEEDNLITSENGEDSSQLPDGKKDEENLLGNEETASNAEEYDEDDAEYPEDEEEENSSAPLEDLSKEELIGECERLRGKVNQLSREMDRLRRNNEKLKKQVTTANSNSGNNNDSGGMDVIIEEAEEDEEPKTIVSLIGDANIKGLYHKPMFMQKLLRSDLHLFASSSLRMDVAQLGKRIIDANSRKTNQRCHVVCCAGINETLQKGFDKTAFVKSVIESLTSARKAIPNMLSVTWMTMPECVANYVVRETNQAVIDAIKEHNNSCKDNQEDKDKTIEVLDLRYITLALDAVEEDGQRWSRKGLAKVACDLLTLVQKKLGMPEPEFKLRVSRWKATLEEKELRMAQLSAAASMYKGGPSGGKPIKPSPGERGSLAPTFPVKPRFNGGPPPRGAPRFSRGRGSSRFPFRKRLGGDFGPSSGSPKKSRMTGADNGSGYNSGSGVSGTGHSETEYLEDPRLAYSGATSSGTGSSFGYGGPSGYKRYRSDDYSSGGGWSRGGY